MASVTDVALIGCKQCSWRWRMNLLNSLNRFILGLFSISEAASACVSWWSVCLKKSTDPILLFLLDCTNMRILNTLLAVLLGAVLTACGGGSDDAAISQPPSTLPPSTPITQPVQNFGGPPSNPTAIDEAAENILSTNRLMNFFKVSAKSGDTIILSADLKSEIPRSDYVNCYGAGKFMVRLDGLTSSCSRHLIHTFLADGIYTIDFDYINNSGSFRAALLRGGESIDHSPSGTGEPKRPRTISLVEKNKISSNDFYNHFIIDLIKDQILYIQVQLDAEIPRQTLVNCSGTGGVYMDDHSFGIRMLKSNFNCGKYIEYKSTYTGTHQVNLRYLNITGTFNAAVSKI